jgi:hypothetical protein
MVRWEVVGGGASGGILVREGQATSSKQCADRLATGSVLDEIKLVGERLQFIKVSGAGPDEGWVSLKASGKDLCVRVKTADPATPETAPKCLRPALETAAQFLPCPVPPPLIKYMSKKKLVDAASQRLKGDMYGLLFPQTPEELNSEKFGARWLTEAFHAAGSLSKDNSIVRIVSCKRFTGGGSGPKGVIEVEYSQPDDSLDTKLFMKMPYPLDENEQQRFIEEGQAKFGDNFGGETVFYRFLSPSVPFPVPKLYFADLSRTSTEAVIINACVQWPHEGKTEFGAYEVFPPCNKYFGSIHHQDYLLKDPHEYYFAIMRRLGTFSGLAKANKLGPHMSQINWYPSTHANDVNCQAGFPGTGQSVPKFITDTAPHWFPDKAKSAAFLERFTLKTEEIYKIQTDIAKYLYEDPMYVGLCHQNGNTDNCYFYKNDNGTIDAGVLDWGSTTHLAYATSFMGSVISGQAGMLVEHDDRLIATWADAYHETGAPRLDIQELIFRYRLALCVSGYGIMSQCNTWNSPDNKAALAKCSAYNCDEIRADFATRFGMSMIFNRIMMFVLKGDTYWSACDEFVKKRAGK